MKIRSSDFVISAVKPDQWPKDGLPEIALAGRSNVGKSSLINTLLNRKNLARTSQRPGKTQTLNYFIINEAFYFVDVPGYGYAKVSQSERRAWVKMLETYLTQNKQLRAVVQVIDLRHAPSAEDVQMYHFLKHYQIPVILVTTKADKISRGKYQQHLKIIREKLNKDPNDPMILFSSFTGLGKDDVWQTISNYLET